MLTTVPWADRSKKLRNIVQKQQPWGKTYLIMKNLGVTDGGPVIKLLFVALPWHLRSLSGLIRITCPRFIGQKEGSTGDLDLGNLVPE
jgi:hypothetical protein